MTWTESELPNGHFVIAFTGFDRDAAEAAEMRAFLEEVKTEPNERRTSPFAAFFRARRDREAKALASRPYELVLTDGAFEVRCEGETSLSVPHAEIASFVGDRRLSIARMDGTTQRLSVCVIATRDHGPLADRLTERLKLTRAARGGYR